MYILRGRTRVRPRFFNRQNAITHLKEVGDGILSVERNGNEEAEICVSGRGLAVVDSGCGSRLLLGLLAGDHRLDDRIEQGNGGQDD